VIFVDMGWRVGGGWRGPRGHTEEKLGEILRRVQVALLCSQSVGSVVMATSDASSGGARRSAMCRLFLFLIPPLPPRRVASRCVALRRKICPLCSVKEPSILFKRHIIKFASKMLPFSRRND